MSDETPTAATETAALRAALAAEQTAIWGYGVVGAALGPAGREPAVAAEAAHRDVRDRVNSLLAARSAAPVKEEGGYALPFPILSPVDAAALGAVLEDGVARAWVRVLGDAAQRTTRELAVGLLSAAEVRAVAWRTAAHKTPVTSALPGL
jgi:hypothetical protein